MQPTDSTPTSDDYIITVDAATGQNKKVFLSDLSTALFTGIAPVGVPIQTAVAVYTEVDTTTTLIPLDNTVPTSSEGKEFMTLSFTPKSATNRLLIEAVAMLSSSAAAYDVIAAIFQDAGAAALAADNQTANNAGGGNPTHVAHDMLAGTTSPITFRVRGGANVAGTTTFNGNSGTRMFGAITKSYLKVTEYRA